MKLLLVAALASCASAPKCDLPPLHPPGRPHVWRAEKPGVPGVIVLVGSIHTIGTADLPPAITKIVDGATRYMSELGDSEPDRAKLHELQRLPGGQTLDQLIPSHDWFELDTAMRDAMTRDELLHARPWFAMVALMNHVAPTPRPSMDAALTARAKDRHVPIIALESWADQMSALDTAADVTALSEVIRERDRLACDFERLRANYLAANMPQLEATLRVTNNPLLADRNRVWLPLIERAATSGTTVVVVGLGHLLGPDSVIALLRADGYEVTRSM